MPADSLLHFELAPEISSDFSGNFVLLSEVLPEKAKELLSVLPWVLP